jgi:soluble lytic murein transglycosylase
VKLTVWRVVAFLLLCALSVGFGFAFDAAATAVERHAYPQKAELADAVSRNAEEYGIPEAILWATLRSGSHFASNAVSDSGAVGLMQLTPAQFGFICTELLGQEPLDAGMLYDPETNLQCGSAYLSYLYRYYGIWDLVYAAYRAGTDTVDAWLTDPACTNGQGVLTTIPDAEVAAYVTAMKKAVSLYRELY